MLAFMCRSNSYGTVAHPREAKLNTISECTCGLEFYRLFPPQNSLALCLQATIKKHQASLSGNEK
jgi:hypothetical protein